MSDGFPEASWRYVADTLSSSLPPNFLELSGGVRRYRLPTVHDTVLSPNERYLFVRNNLLNLEGMSDNSITVIDLAKRERVVRSIDKLRRQNVNPNCIMLLPNHFCLAARGQ